MFITNTMFKKMKLKTLFILFLITALTASCIKEEGLDREADIVSISLDDKNFLTAIINEQTKEISLVMEGDISKYNSGTIAPQIEVSPNATVSPASLEPARLDGYKCLYTVKSQDGNQKIYVVSITSYTPLVQSFEDWNIINPESSKPYEIPGDPMWTNANQGVNMLYKGTVFPTRSINEWRPGSTGRKSVMLETIQGNRNNTVGVMDIPVYAGNMFRGEFAIGEALKNPLLTTKFGQPHPEHLGKPLYLVAYYKYKSGTPYLSYEGGVKDVKDVKEYPDRKDQLDIYAILFKVPKGEEGRNIFLTADDIKTSDRIVATAFLEDRSEKADWEYLKLAFAYKEAIDFEKNDYKLTVVMTSSTDGAMYQGAIGSQLVVDDLRVVCDSDDDKDEFRD